MKICSKENGDKRFDLRLELKLDLGLDFLDKALCVDFVLVFWADSFVVVWLCVGLRFGARFDSLVW